jgi:hypothetical protein
MELRTTGARPKENFPFIMIVEKEIELSSYPKRIEMAAGGGVVAGQTAGEGRVVCLKRAAHRFVSRLGRLRPLPCFTPGPGVRSAAASPPRATYQYHHTD